MSPYSITQVHAKAKSVLHEHFESSNLLLPILGLNLSPNQLALAATLLRGNAAAVKMNGDQEEAAQWLKFTASALINNSHPIHSWMLPGVMNDAANRCIRRFLY